jgi:DNA replication protein
MDEVNNDTSSDDVESIFNIIEREFARTLSPMETEIIKAWLNSSYNTDLIKEAIKEATFNGVSNLRYIDKIIYEWNKKGYKTVEDVINNKFKKEKEDNKDKYFFEYNWLDEN